MNMYSFFMVIEMKSNARMMFCGDVDGKEDNHAEIQDFSDTAVSGGA